jgi:hypothetical protein
MSTTGGTTGRVEYLDPEGLAHSPAFSNVVAVTGPNPPLITVALVSGLARPDALVELDAPA